MYILTKICFLFKEYLYEWGLTRKGYCDKIDKSRGYHPKADRGAGQISNSGAAVCGDCRGERLTAEECTFRNVHIWLCVKQAYGCHRSDGELSHIYISDITIMSR